MMSVVGGGCKSEITPTTLAHHTMGNIFYDVPVLKTPCFIFDRRRSSGIWWETTLSGLQTRSPLPGPSLPTEVLSFSPASK